MRLQTQVIDQIHDAVVSTDLEGKVTSWNLGAERIFGYTAAQAIGQSIAMVYSQDQLDVLFKDVIEPLKQKSLRKADIFPVPFYLRICLNLLHWTPLNKMMQ